MVQEIVRFLKVDTAFMNIRRPLRYCLLFDSHPSAPPRGARFQARNLKLQDALLTSYRRNEVSCFACLLEPGIFVTADNLSYVGSVT